MNTEKEMKFYVSKSSDLIHKLIKNSSENIGIIQWYINTDEETEERIRLNIRLLNDEYSYEWIKTIKKDTKNFNEREEIEESLDYYSEDINLLKDKPCVIKIRHVIKFDPEIVIDEYLFQDNINYNIQDKYDLNKNYIIEVEEKKTKNIDLLNEAKALFGDNLDFIDKIDEKSLKNKKIANIFNFDEEKKLLNIDDIRFFIENRLKGKVDVFLSLGLSLKNNINNKNKNIFDEIKKMFEDKNYYSRKALIDCSAEIGTLIHLKESGFDISKVYTYVSSPFVNESFKDDFLEKKDDEFRNNYLSYFDSEVDDFDQKEYFINNESNENRFPSVYPFFYKICTDILNIKVEYISNDYDSKDSNKSKSLFVDTWNVLDKLYKESSNLIFDIGPGNKLLSIIVSLYALFNKKEFYYKFETGDIFRFPEIGIDWDYQYLDELYNIINNYNNKNFEKIYEYLPKNIQSLYYKNNENLKEFFPVEMILKSYKERRDMPFGYGESYLSFIKNDELSNYIKYGIFNKWTHMWVGDLIPETVEHSQRHSKRLMEMTVKIIRIIGERNFLPEVELEKEYVKNVNYRDLFYFLFGVALNVHDLGHTYSKFKLKSGEYFYVDLFPSLVRDLHNELTLNLIDDNFFDILAIENKFSKYSKTLNELFEDKSKEIIKAIKLICKYHRGYLPIDSKKNNNKKFVDIFEIDNSPLNEIVGSFEDDNLKEIIIHSTRWIKFIDGTDVQNDRIVTKSYHEMKKQRTFFDLIIMIDKFLKDNENLSDNDQLNYFTNEFKSIKNILNSENQNYDTIEKIANSIEENLYENIRLHINNDEIKKQDEEISLNVLSQINKIIFKARQFPHFDKHFAVNSVFPTWFEWSDKKNITIIHFKLIKNPDFKGDSKYINSIKENISEELNLANIRINGKKLEIHFDY
jgi:dihydroneopterin aldolase